MNRNITALFFSFPLIASAYAIVVQLLVPGFRHSGGILHIALLCTSFSIIVCYVYSTTGLAGAGIGAGVIIIGLFAAIPGQLGWIYWIIAAIAAIRFLKIFRIIPIRGIKLSLAVSVCVACLLLAPYFSLEYSQPFNDIKLPLGQVHLDTLYHLAIAGMLKTHLAISHGLHGLGALEYHFGSHSFLAGASSVLGVSVWDSYNYVFPFFCIPLLTISVLVAAEELFPSGSTRKFAIKALVLLSLMLGSGVLSQGSTLSKFALWPSFYESESYTISLILLIALLSLLLSQNPAVKTRTIFISILVIFPALTLMKISSGFAALIFLGFWSLFFWRRIVLTASCSVIFLALSRLINPSMSDVSWEPLQFINTYAPPISPVALKVLLFQVLHFIFPVITFAGLLIRRILRNSDFPIPVWYILGITATWLVGVIVVTFFRIMGGSGYYFSNLSMFVSLPLLICLIAAFFSAETSQQVNRKKHTFTFLKIAGAALAVILFVRFAPAAITAGAKSLSENLKKAEPQSPLTPYITHLHKIRDNAGTRNSLVHIPRDENRYWNAMYCKATGYFIPAVSERPAIFAWPAKQCYDFLCGPRFHAGNLCERSQNQYTESELLAEAEKLGFRSVLIVREKMVKRIGSL